MRVPAQFNFNGMSLAAIEESFSKIINHRDAAEAAFALAQYYCNLGQMRKAKTWALLSINYFEMCDTRSIVSCTPVHEKIGGITLPDLIHEGVVKSRLESWLAASAAA